MLKFSFPLLLTMLTMAVAETKPAPATAAKQPDLAAMKKKAETGDPAAQFELANYIFSTGGKEGKLEDAVKWLEKSSDANHAPAMMALARYLTSIPKPDNERAKFLIQNAAEAGFAPAQTAYGVVLCNEVDMKAHDVDFTECVKWLRRAADQKDPEALCKLGIMYHNGQGVKVDETEGYKLISQAAKTGYALAINEAGVCLQQGRGVPVDEIAAVGYFHAAADLGIPAATVNLGQCYENGRGVPQSYPNAGAAYARGAKMSFALAQVALARLFAEGLGTVANPVFAYVNYARAALSIPEVAAKRDAIKGKLTEAQLAEATQMLEKPEDAK